MVAYPFMSSTDEFITAVSSRVAPIFMLRWPIFFNSSVGIYRMTSKFGMLKLLTVLLTFWHSTTQLSFLLLVRYLFPPDYTLLKLARARAW